MTITKNDTTVTELEEMIKRAFDLREKYHAVKEAASTLYEELEKQQALISGTLEELGMEKYSSKFGSFTYRWESSYLVPKLPEDKKAFFDYLREKGIFEEMITIHSATLNSYAKAEAKANCKEDIDLPGIQRGVLTLKVNMRKD